MVLDHIRHRGNADGECVGDEPANHMDADFALVGVANAVDLDRLAVDKESDNQVNLPLGEVAEATGVGTCAGTIGESRAVCVEEVKVGCGVRDLVETGQLRGGGWAVGVQELSPWAGSE